MDQKNQKHNEIQKPSSNAEPTIVKLKGRRLNKTGNAYHIIVPRAYVDDADLLEAGEEYDIIFQRKESLNDPNEICTLRTAVGLLSMNNGLQNCLNAIPAQGRL